MFAVHQDPKLLYPFHSSTLDDRNQSVSRLGLGDHVAARKSDQQSCLRGFGARQYSARRSLYLWVISFSDFGK